jgi:hypothetical protein
MSTRVARLGEDPYAPFYFRRGERVAWRRWDGSPDREISGTIVDGICEYEPGGGAYRDSYVIQLDNGMYFGADSHDLVPLQEGKEETVTR